VSHHSLPLIFGEVLFDCFPDGREKLGGAPFNVAWNLKALGMPPLLVSRVGDDDHGRRIRKKMKSWDMDISFLQTDPSYPTGKVRIKLTNGEPQFTILPDQAYDHISPLNTKLQNEPAFLYHGSLALRNDVSRDTLSLLKRNYQCPVFVDVNLRAPWWNAENVYTFLEDATWLKLNEDEMKTLFPEQGDFEHRCTTILNRFSLEAVFVTRGSKGAFACTRENLSATVKPGENIDIADTVGAGDAFSSVLLLGLTKRWPLKTILERAQEFASAVVGMQGAVSEHKIFYQAFTSQWELQ